MSRDVRGFSQSYREARERFLAEAEGFAQEQHLHPLRGRDGEALALDVARDGPADAGALIVVSSGCHGLEGYCGSGIQVALMRDEGWREAARRAGVALLWLHALNPWGFSWGRRTTEDNVDLNRNFHDFTRPLPANPGYDELAAHVVPPHWPPSADDEAALAAYARRHGEAALREAVTGGQYRHPAGVFYGGHEPGWSHRTLREVLRRHGGRCQRLAWIDLHTGLGPRGHGERIFACRDDAAALRRARAWWGPELTSIYDGSSSSALLTGLMFNAAYDECAQAEYTGLALEFGTVPFDEVTEVLRHDQWIVNQGLGLASPEREALRPRLRDAFYIDEPGWKAQVVAQARQALQQTVAGISAPG